MAKEFFSAAPDPENPDKSGTPGQENIPEYIHPVSFNSGEKTVREDMEPAPENIEVNPEIQKKPESPAENKEKTDEEKEAKENIEKLPAEERQKLGIGIHTVGFAVQEKKNEFFEKTYDWLAKTSGNKTAGKFFAAESKIFKREAAKAHKRIEEISSDKKKRTIQNTAQLGGTVVKYGRTVADIVGITAGSPLRYAMMGSMAFARGAEGVKEVRLMNEGLIDKTRIQDADKAAEEAWRIREEAANKSKDGKVTAEELNAAYKEQLPQDLLKRLETKPEERAGLMNRIVQGVFRKEMESSAKNLSGKVEKIEKNEKLSAAEKKNKREALFQRYEKRMNDYDRMLTQYGTIDTLAMGARHMELAGKAAVAAMTVETLFLTGEKLFEISSHLSFGHLFEGIGSLLTKGGHSSGIGGKGTGFFSPDMAGHGAHAGVIDTSAAGRAQADSIFGSHGTIPESGSKEAVSNIGGKPSMADTTIHPEPVAAADTVKTIPITHEQPAWAHDAAAKDTTMPGHIQEQPVLAHDTAKVNADTTITRGGTKEISPNIVAEKPVISEAVPQIHDANIEKGSGIFAAAHKMVEQGTVSEKDFQAALANPESSALVDGKMVPLRDIDLVHQGDSVRFIEGVNGKAPRLELILGGKGKAGTSEDLYNAMKGHKSEYVQRKVLGVTEKEALEDVARSKRPSILETIRNAFKSGGASQPEVKPQVYEGIGTKSQAPYEGIGIKAKPDVDLSKEFPKYTPPKPASERINELDPRYWRNEPVSGHESIPFKHVEPQPEVAKVMQPIEHTAGTAHPLEHQNVVEHPIEAAKPVVHPAENIVHPDVAHPVEAAKPLEQHVESVATAKVGGAEQIRDIPVETGKPMEGVSGTVRFNYDQNGDPVGIETNVSVRGTSGDEFFKPNWFETVLAKSKANNIDMGLMRNKSTYDGRILYMYEKIYEQVSKNPDYGKQTAYLAKMIRTMIERMTKDYGDVIDPRNLPEALRGGLK